MMTLDKVHDEIFHTLRKIIIQQLFDNNKIETSEETYGLDIDDQAKFPHISELDASYGYEAKAWKAENIKGKINVMIRTPDSRLKGKKFDFVIDDLSLDLDTFDAVSKVNISFKELTYHQ